MTDSTALLDGLDAFYSGLLRSACPHAEDSPECYLWNEGWVTAYTVSVYGRNPWRLDLVSYAIH